MAFVVFAGQSNTGGYQAEQAPPPAWTPDPKILIWDDSQRAWVQMQPGVNTGYGGFPNTWGPEVTFALAFRQAYPDEELRIVKQAEGGTGLRQDTAQWAYDWSPDSADELFDRVTRVIHDASAAAGGMRPDAVFWGQGEEDGREQAWAQAYAGNLTELFAAIRAEWLGDPNGKIGFFQVYGSAAYAGDVRQAQATVDAQDPNAVSFDTATFPMQSDHVHYAPEGFRMIGDEYFKIYTGWHSAGGGATGQDLNGTAADDTLIGGAGDDRIAGGDGANYLRGGEGRDLIAGGSGFDDAHGNQGDDTIAGGGGGDWVVGGKDNDRLFGDDGADIVYGNLGADTLSGGAAADLIRGGQGDDVIRGEDGNDWLSGDRGNDTLTGGAGADIFHGSQDAGIDRVLDFNLAEGDRVQLDPGTTYVLRQSGADTLIDMGGGHQMVLVNTQLSSLSGDWIFSA